MGPTWSMEIPFHSEVTSRCDSDFWLAEKNGFSDRIQRQNDFSTPPKKNWMILKGISLKHNFWQVKCLIHVVLFIDVSKHRDVSCLKNTFNVGFFLCFNRFLWLFPFFFWFSSLPRLEQKNNHMFFFQWGIHRFFASDPDPNGHHLDTVQTLMPWIWTRLLKICCWRKRRRPGVAAGPGDRWWDSDGDLEPFFFCWKIYLFGTMDLVKSGIYILCSLLL